MSVELLTVMQTVLDEHQATVWSMGDVECRCGQFSARIAWKAGESSMHRSRNLRAHRQHVAEQIEATVFPLHRKIVLEAAAVAMVQADSRAFPGRGWDYQYAEALRRYSADTE